MSRGDPSTPAPSTKKHPRTNRTTSEVRALNSAELAYSPMFPMRFCSSADTARRPSCAQRYEFVRSKVRISCAQRYEFEALCWSLLRCLPFNASSLNSPRVSCFYRVPRGRRRPTHRGEAAPSCRASPEPFPSRRDTTAQRKRPSGSAQGNVQRRQRCSELSRAAAFWSRPVGAASSSGRGHVTARLKSGQPRSQDRAHGHGVQLQQAWPSDGTCVCWSTQNECFVGGESRSPTGGKDELV